MVFMVAAGYIKRQKAKPMKKLPTENGEAGCLSRAVSFSRIPLANSLTEFLNNTQIQQMVGIEA